MKIVIHDLLNGSEHAFEGDRYSIERQISQEYPWFTEWHPHGALEEILAIIESQQFLAVEVLNDKEHPLAE